MRMAPAPFPHTLASLRAPQAPSTCPPSSLSLLAVLLPRLPSCPPPPVPIQHPEASSSLPLTAWSSSCLDQDQSSDEYYSRTRRDPLPPLRQRRTAPPPSASVLASLRAPRAPSPCPPSKLSLLAVLLPRLPSCVPPPLPTPRPGAASSPPLTAWCSPFLGQDQSSHEYYSRTHRGPPAPLRQRRTAPVPSASVSASLKASRAPSPCPQSADELSTSACRASPTRPHHAPPPAPPLSRPH